MMNLNDISAYDYELPEELIAQTPLDSRDSSRLMVLDRKAQTIEHKRFSDLINYLSPEDCIVFNNTKVVPARLKGFRKATKGKWEGLFLKQVSPVEWIILGKTKGKLKPGETICVNPVRPNLKEPLELILQEKLEDGHWRVILNGGTSIDKGQGDLETIAEKFTYEVLLNYGELPLPPYIKRDEVSLQDMERYQTVYAEMLGAVAAPTAGLHFTPDLLSQIHQHGTKTEHVTLHVGLGTFKPIAHNNLDEHTMHEEWCQLTESTHNTIKVTRKIGGKLTAVGTTVVRTLESAALNGELSPCEETTNLFIKPGFQFHVVDQLVTNFHLPKSTLLVLVSAFAGYEFIKAAYEEAVREKYRFFSYGDAMLIL